MGKHRILVINIGATSTKVAFFEEEKPMFKETVSHSAEELAPYQTFLHQGDFRRKVIEKLLHQKRVRLEELSIIVSRGGGTRPISTGAYRINEAMCDDLLSGVYERHPANWGPVIAYEMAKSANIPAIVVDSPSSDEFEPLARFSGLPEIKRRSGFHVLNQKAAARKAAQEMNERYENLNLLVVHLGGGISVGAHRKGRIIDASHGIEEGPFSPDRTGSLPVLELLDLCFSGKYTKEQLQKKLIGAGGLSAYLGTNEAREVERRISEGDEEALTVYQAMAYQISKEIGAMATVLEGKVDAIVLTGGLAHSEMLIDWIKRRVCFIAPIKVYPGEDEIRALASGALRVLRGEETLKEYPQGG